MAKAGKRKKGARVPSTGQESLELSGKSVKARGKNAVRWTLAAVALIGVVGLALYKSGTTVSSSGNNSPAIGTMESGSLTYGGETK